MCFNCLILAIYGRWLLHSAAHNPRSHLKPVSHEAEVEEAMSEEDEEGDQGEVEELAEHEPAEVDVVSGDKYLFDYLSMMMALLHTYCGCFW